MRNGHGYAFITLYHLHQGCISNDDWINWVWINLWLILQLQQLHVIKIVKVTFWLQTRKYYYYMCDSNGK